MTVRGQAPPDPSESNPLLAVPPVSDRRIAARVSAGALRHARRGHPWIFQDAITSLSFEGEAGDLAVIFDDDRQFAAIGLYDPGSPIRIRLLHAGKPRAIDDEFFVERLGDAAAIRQPLLEDQQVDAYRLVNGENDGLPGLILDRYANVVVLKLYSPAWLPHLQSLVRALSTETVGFEVEAVVLRLARQVVRGETFGLEDGQVLSGQVTAPVVFTENGLVFEADVVSGQKTGHFLDQRDNRRRVRDMSQGVRVLDVFSCTGGFSVHAAAGGATEVHSVDISPHAIAAAEQHMSRNAEEIPGCRHRTTVGDAFEVMADLAKNRERYDLVVVDPPSFAQKQSDVDRAIRAYRKLTSLAVDLVRPGGHLVQASCSSRIGAEDFFAIVRDGVTGAGRTLSGVGVTGHPSDHPIGFPEGAYLKALFGEVN